MVPAFPGLHQNCIFMPIVSFLGHCDSSFFKFENFCEKFMCFHPFLSMDSQHRGSLVRGLSGFPKLITVMCLNLQGTPPSQVCYQKKEHGMRVFELLIVIIGLYVPLPGQSLLFQCIIDGAQKWGSQRSRSNVLKQCQGLLQPHLWVKRTELSPATEDTLQVLGSLGISLGKFYLFFHEEGSRKVQRASMSDFCSLIACLILALEQSWLVYLSYIGEKWVTVLEEKSTQS